MVLAGPADLVRRAGRLRIPLTLSESPPGCPWQAEFLPVRPDQHIAWRADDPAGLDIKTAAGFGLTSGRAHQAQAGDLLISRERPTFLRDFSPRTR